MCNNYASILCGIGYTKSCTRGILFMKSTQRREVRYQRRKEKRLLNKIKRCDTIGGIDGAFTFGNMYKCGKECCNGVRWKHSVQNFELHLFSTTAKSLKDVKTDSWKSNDYFRFVLTERGKTRDIDAPKIVDRQVHKAITQNILLPLYMPCMIYNNGASQKGKGFHFSSNELKKDLRKHFKKYGREGWILLIDFKKFFPNAKHENIYENHKELIFDEKLRELCDYVVGFNNSSGFGMPLGVEPSQAEMIFFPWKLDCYLTCQCGFKGCGHYMDDYYVIIPPSVSPQDVRERVLSFAESLGIKVNRDKSYFVKLTKSFRYCKIRYRLTETGAVKTLGSRPAYRRASRKIRAFRRMVDNGQMEYEDVYCSMNSIISYFDNFNDNNRSFRLKQLFKKTFGFRYDDLETFRRRDFYNV